MSIAHHEFPALNANIYSLLSNAITSLGGPKSILRKYQWIFNTLSRFKNLESRNHKEFGWNDYFGEIDSIKA